MRNRKKIIFFILYWLIYIGLVQRYLFKHELLTLVPDILVFYVSYLTYKNKKKKSLLKYYLGNILPIFIKILFFASIIGAVVNLTNPITYIWGLRIIVRYLLLIWIIYQNFELSDVEKYKKIIYKAFEINVLFCLFQIFQGEWADLIGGTFIGNGGVMLLALITLLLASGDFLYKQMKIWKFYAYLVGMLLIAILAEIKMMYFLFPLIFYGGYVLHKNFSMNHIFILILAFFFLIPVMQFAMSFYYNEQYIEHVFDIDYIEEETSHAYGFHEGGFNRATAIALANETMLTDTEKKMFGYGLGSGSISSLFATSLYSHYHFTTYWNFSTSYCLVEMGWIGFTLYALCFLCLMFRFGKIYNKTKDPFIRYWAAIGLLSVCATFILCWYNDNPYFKYLPMYFLWGICFVAIKERQKRFLFYNH